MFTVDYFIEKFEKISENDFVNDSSGCAYTHCGLFKKKVSEECVALSDLFDLYIKSNRLAQTKKICGTYHGYSWLVTFINDNGLNNDTGYNQPTAKQRILAALYDIKQRKAVEQVQDIVNTKTEKCKIQKQEY